MIRFTLGVAAVRNPREGLGGGLDFKSRKVVPREDASNRK
jgi:hypothetical protein